jgi:hypothetical protein
MNQGVLPPLVLVFFTVWIALGLGGVIFFFRSKNAKLKKRVFPWYVGGAGTLFARFVVLLTGEPALLFLIVPAVLLISYGNIRTTKFCESCGTTLLHQGWFTKARYCSYCGAPLEE